jgi:Holliday junction resolvase RusA-like endonuclease
MPSFTIPGKPFAKQRHRTTRAGRSYTPAETVSFERTVGTIAGPLFPRPMQGPVSLAIVAHFQMPASWPRKKREAMNGKPHIQKPDLSNVQKAIEDGLNRIAYDDDCQVASCHVRKFWTDRPSQTLVRVEALA